MSGGRGGHLFGTVDYKFKGENVYFSYLVRMSCPFLSGLD